MADNKWMRGKKEYEMGINEWKGEKRVNPVIQVNNEWFNFTFIRNE